MAQKYLLDGNILTELEEIKKQYEEHTGIKKKEIKRHTVDFILSSTAIEMDAIIVSDDRIFQKIKEFRPSLRVENWKEA
jgi:predicted nucleic acid-binding protein